MATTTTTTPHHHQQPSLASLLDGIATMGGGGGDEQQPNGGGEDPFTSSPSSTLPQINALRQVWKGFGLITGKTGGVHKDVERAIQATSELLTLVLGQATVMRKLDWKKWAVKATYIVLLSTTVTTQFKRIQSVCSNLSLETALTLAKEDAQTFLDGCKDLLRLIKLKKKEGQCNTLSVDEVGQSLSMTRLTHTYVKAQRQVFFNYVWGSLQDTALQGTSKFAIQLVWLLFCVMRRRMEGPDVWNAVLLRQIAVATIHNLLHGDFSTHVPAKGGNIGGMPPATLVTSSSAPPPSIPSAPAAASEADIAMLLSGRFLHAPATATVAPAATAPTTAPVIISSNINSNNNNPSGLVIPRTLTTMCTKTDLNPLDTFRVEARVRLAMKRLVGENAWGSMLSPGNDYGFVTILSSDDKCRLALSSFEMFYGKAVNLDLDTVDERWPPATRLLSEMSEPTCLPNSLPSLSGNDDILMMTWCNNLSSEFTGDKRSPTLTNIVPMAVMDEITKWLHGWLEKAITPDNPEPVMLCTALFWWLVEVFVSKDVAIGKSTTTTTTNGSLSHDLMLPRHFYASVFIVACLITDRAYPQTYCVESYPQLLSIIQVSCLDFFKVFILFLQDVRATLPAVLVDEQFYHMIYRDLLEVRGPRDPAILRAVDMLSHHQQYQQISGELVAIDTFLKCARDLCMEHVFLWGADIAGLHNHVNFSSIMRMCVAACDSALRHSTMLGTGDVMALSACCLYACCKMRGLVVVSFETIMDTILRLSKRSVRSRTMVFAVPLEPTGTFCDDIVTFYNTVFLPYMQDELIHLSRMTVVDPNSTLAALLREKAHLFLGYETVPRSSIRMVVRPKRVRPYADEMDDGDGHHHDHHTESILCISERIRLIRNISVAPPVVAVAAAAAAAPWQLPSHPLPIPASQYGGGGSNPAAAASSSASSFHQSPAAMLTQSVFDE